MMSATPQFFPTGMHFGAMRGNESLVRLWLSAGSDVDAEGGPHSWTPLFYAVMAGQFAIVKLLLDSGCCLDHADVEGYTVIHYAAFNKQPKILKLLISAGAEIDKPGLDMTTPLHISVQTGCEDCVNVLLGAGADLTKTTAKGMTAIHLACRYTQRRILHILLDAKAEVNVCDNIFGSPLMYATAGDHPDMVSALLDAGSDPNLSTTWGGTALMVAKDISIIQTLLDHGATPKATSVDGCNVLHRCALRGSSSEIIHMLYNAGADVTAISQSGHTPADIARREGHFDTAKY